MEILRQAAQRLGVAEKQIAAGQRATAAIRSTTARIFSGEKYMMTLRQKITS